MEYFASWLFVCVATVSFHGLRYLITIVESNLVTSLNKGETSENHTNSDVERGNAPTGTGTRTGMESTFLIGKKGSSSGVVHHSFDKRQIFMLRLSHASLSGLSYCLALLLMLVAMTYNSGLFLALVVGYALGDFIFFTRTVSVGRGATTAGGGAGQHRGGVMKAYSTSYSEQASSGCH